jgi:hypothetical protein
VELPKKREYKLSLHAGCNIKIAS